MLLDLWFHHTNSNRPGGPYWAPIRRIERKKENDEALLIALGML